MSFEALKDQAMQVSLVERGFNANTTRLANSLVLRSRNTMDNRPGPCLITLGFYYG